MSSTELLANGVKCNLACTYCYQDPMREAGNYSPGYDMDAMKAGLEAEGNRFTLFGGEALLMPLPDLEEILRWGKERFGGSSVQTNGALVTLEHVEMFRRHAVSVGISVDGPAELNDARWAGTLEKTRAATETTMRAIDMLCALGMAPGLIVTLHRKNASAERLPRLADWLRGLDLRGVWSVGLHLLEVDSPQARAELALTDDENVHALVSLMRLQESLPHMRFDLFREMASLLVGSNDAKCVWGGCDPLTTPAVHGVDGLGGRQNCGRTNKDGVSWVKTEGHGTERYLMLHQTPQADGGCKGCRFFYACKGQCPGTAIDGDWRNRTEHCQVWFRMLELIETELRLAGKLPISADPARRQAVEREMFARLGADQDHGDHWDAPDGFSHDDNNFTVHGDNGTTTTHGDHGDASAS